MMLDVWQASPDMANSRPAAHCCKLHMFLKFSEPFDLNLLDPLPAGPAWHCAIQRWRGSAVQDPPFCAVAFASGPGRTHHCTILYQPVLGNVACGLLAFVPTALLQSRRLREGLCSSADAAASKGGWDSCHTPSRFCDASIPYYPVRGLRTSFEPCQLGLPVLAKAVKCCQTTSGLGTLLPWRRREADADKEAWSWVHHILFILFVQQLRFFSAKALRDQLTNMWNRQPRKLVHLHLRLQGQNRLCGEPWACKCMQHTYAKSFFKGLTQPWTFNYIALFSSNSVLCLDFRSFWCSCQLDKNAYCTIARQIFHPLFPQEFSLRILTSQL